MSHPSNLPHAIDRALDNPEQQSVVFYGDKALIQGGELNELQTIERNRSKRISNLIAKDGDRVAGGEALVDLDAGTVLLTTGKVYLAGDVIDVVGATLTGVAMTGLVKIGVRLVKTWITHEDDPELVGQIPGTLAEGEPGAAREIASLTWAVFGDAQPGEFFAVYLLQDGTILDQTPPPALDGITNAISVYDFSAHGHYIVEGCRVTALGVETGDQIFSVEDGEANVHGFKLVRRAAMRMREAEAWDVAAVPGETHTFGAGASETISTNRFPIDQITTILLTKEKTVSLTRGAVTHGADALPDNSVVEIVLVTQGGTTYVENTDFVRTGDTIDWQPAGAEPATGSSYNVTYYYRDSIVADSFTEKEITVSGGVDGEDIIVAYTWKLPRIDLICLGQNGAGVYVKGVSSAKNSLPPITPVQLLKLAEVHNDWLSKPVVQNNGIYNRTMEDLDRLARTQEDLVRLLMIERSKSSIDAREPVAKRNMFIDPLMDDTYRDQGEVQTAAIGAGFMQLPMTPTFLYATLSAPVMLDWVEEVVISQELSTGCEKINPYQNFAPLPAAMNMEPAVDYWSETGTQWLSPATNEFTRGVRTDGGPLSEISQTVSNFGSRTEQVEFLRTITLTAKIRGFGDGENLSELVFDNIDVKPGGVQTANASGELDVSFSIPANIPTGSKTIIAVGEGASYATATFTGQGSIIISVMQRVTNISRWSLPPLPPVVITAPVIAAALFTPNWDDDDDDDDGRTWFERVTNKFPVHDPQAQTFTPPDVRQLVGVDFKICTIGDDSNNILVHQVTVENGTPTTDIVAEAFVPMAGVVLGWKSARYNLPTLTLIDKEHAFVIKTDDGDHAVSVANLGDFDADNQAYVSAHPYPIGVRLSSVNARTWTPHQKSALTFRVIAAKFTSLTKTVALGSHDLVNCSDLQIRATVELPDSNCSVIFEIERTNGEIYQLLPEQVLQLDEFLTETVELRAILTGTKKLSPVLFAPVMLVAGELGTSGTYITRAFDAGTAVRLTAYFKAFLPAGSSVDIDYDLADDNWVALPHVSTEALGFSSWTEPKHEVDPVTASLVRLRITLNGLPSARPRLGDLGAAIL